jgi:hypothetical protein
VRSVRTKPGQIVVTCTPVRAMCTRRDSSRLICAASGAAVCLTGRTVDAAAAR